MQHHYGDLEAAYFDAHARFEGRCRLVLRR
jgi:hypothetical protein